ncbi:AAA family ATPase [Deinococcus ruber]|uniref:Phosphotransferase n=1 Tax=Deinococcus ruber TaxID=1848197 RepID=A0A918C5J0_9DEIO|nr:AAA family ATPase [Deinococcus ruber]GGR04878.1 hypothetical protein GCM10008957_17250 [Deinococcus ruber]
MKGAVLLLSGVPGTGKSSLAQAWLRTFPRGLHLPVDTLRELVVSGIAHPSLSADPEAARQFALARRVAFSAAALYAHAGFAVAIDDVIWPHDPDALSAELLGGLSVSRLFLTAQLETVLERNRTRTGKPFEPEMLEPIIRVLHASMNPADFAAAGWQIISSEGKALAHTLETVLKNGAPSRVWERSAAGLESEV